MEVICLGHCALLHSIQCALYIQFSYSTLPFISAMVLWTTTSSFQQRPPSPYVLYSLFIINTAFPENGLLLISFCCWEHCSSLDSTVGSKYLQCSTLEHPMSISISAVTNDGRNKHQLPSCSHTNQTPFSILFTGPNYLCISSLLLKQLGNFQSSNAKFVPEYIQNMKYLKCKEIR